MGISVGRIGSIGDYGSILQNYYVPTIPRVNVENIGLQNSQADAMQTLPVNDIHEEASVAVAARQDAPLEDISITFNKQESFDYIGQDSDIQSLDVQKAISDMKKDRILQQYQYFVGSSRNLMTQSADGAVFAKF